MWARNITTRQGQDECGLGQSNGVGVALDSDAERKLAGPRSEISHLDLSAFLKHMFFSGGQAIEKMSSTCTANMTIPEGVR